MSGRKRLTAAERRRVEPVVAGVVAELEPLVSQMEVTLVNALVVLPVELRVEALTMAMNQACGPLITGAGVALGARTGGQ